MAPAFRRLQVTCPYCAVAWIGPDAHNWIKKHVAIFHPDLLEAFQTLPRSSYCKMYLTKQGLAKQKREEHLRKKKEEMMKEDENTMQDEKPAEKPPQVEQKPVVQNIPVTPKTVIFTKKIQPDQEQQSTHANIVASEPEKKKLTLPIDIPLEPEAWLAEFFMKFDLNQKFIVFQTEKYKITHKFPHPKELLADLNELDSGSKLKRQNDLIVWFYETALTDYQNKLQRLSMPYDRPIIDFQPDPLRTGSSYTDRGISVERQLYPTSDQFPRQTTTYSSEQQNELRELKAKVEAMQQEKFNEMQNKLRDLELKYEQAKSLPHQDSNQQRLEAKLEQMENETKQLQQKLSEQAQQNLMKEIQGAKEAALQVSQRTPTMDMIQQLITQTIEQDRTMKLRPEELEQKIKDIVNKEKTGITPEAVQMSQIEKTYELDKLKLEAEKDKSGMWGDTIKSVAAVFGESLGKGLAGGVGQPQAPPPQNPNTIPTGPLENQEVPEEPKVKTCPACNKSMLFQLPSGVNVGQCPYCRTPLQLTPSDELVVFDLKQPIQQDRQPPPAQPKPAPVQTPQMTNGDTLGHCIKCGRTLYYFNIAETDLQGQKWCKQCSEAKQNGIP